jgi:hypothetical protein
LIYILKHKGVAHQYRVAPDHCRVETVVEVIRGSGNRTGSSVIPKQVDSTLARGEGWDTELKGHLSFPSVSGHQHRWGVLPVVVFWGAHNEPMQRHIGDYLVCCPVFEVEEARDEVGPSCPWEEDFGIHVSPLRLI